MNIKKIKKLLLIILFLFSLKSIAAQDAIVATDGAMVYKKADFDSTVIGYFRSGQKVRLSNKTFGPFYRVAFKQGVVGYISDVDVEVKGGKSGKTNSIRPEVQKSLISKTMFGPSLAYVSYMDTVGNKKYSDYILMYGVKFNFPFTLFSGPYVFDINLLYSNQVPNFYSKLSTTPPSATILFLDANIVASLFENRNRSFGLYAGAGPMISYTSFSNIDLANTGQKFVLSEAVFGGHILGGTSFKLGSFTLKTEGHYFILKNQFFGLQTSLQYNF